MPREPLVPTDQGNLIHVVGRITDEVYSFFGPAIRALEEAGRSQVVVLIDDPRYRHHLPDLPDSLVLVLVPKCGNPLEQWLFMLRACQSRLGYRGIVAVHVHGLLPCVVGVIALWSLAHPASMIFSPHSSRSLSIMRVVGRAIRPVMRPLLKRNRHSVIINVPWESAEFEKWKETSLIESPVDDVFFTTPRNEARHPLIMTGGREQSVRNAELFARLAVLLGGNDLKIGFNWIGAVDATTQARLNAAGIGVFDCVQDEECASRLAAGWIYLAPGSTRGFPVSLAKAMAVGLACVVFDCIQHRELIVDGETGYLCRSDREMIHRLAALIDNPELRSRLGQAARAAARERFSESAFQRKLLEAYELER